MKYLLAALFSLATATKAADIIPPQNVTVVIGGGGSDPSKLPLTGGTMTGPLAFSNSPGFAQIQASSDALVSGLEVGISSNALGLGLADLKSTGSDKVGLVFSTGPIGTPLLSGQLGFIILDNTPSDRQFQFSMGTNFGAMTLGDTNARLNVNGGSSSFVVYPSSAGIIGSPVVVSGGVLDATQETSVQLPATVNIPTIPPSHALCLNASHNISQCTTNLDATGVCTCP